MSDEDIDYSDIPPLDEKFFVRVTMPPKKQLTIRLDSDVLDWFKAHGRGYQTRINRILRVVMESQPPVPQPKRASKSASERRLSSRPQQRSTAAAKRRSVS